jgi:predicted nucleotidyltransferase
VDERALAAFCERHHIRRLAFFGSVLRDDFGPASDIDVLVEFRDGFTPGFGLIAMQDELSGIVGRRVDLVTPGFFGPRNLRRVLSEAEVHYASS